MKETIEGLCELVMQCHEGSGRWPKEKAKKEPKQEDPSVWWSERATRVSEWLVARGDVWDLRSRHLFLDALVASHLPARLMITTPLGPFLLCPVSLFLHTDPADWNASLLILLRDHEVGVDLRDLLWSVITSVALQDQFFSHGEALFHFLMAFFDDEQRSDEEITLLFMQAHNERFAELLAETFASRIVPEFMMTQFYGPPKNVSALRFGLARAAFLPSQLEQFVQDPPTKAFLKCVLKSCDYNLLWKGSGLPHVRAIAWHLELNRDAWDDEFLSKQLLFQTIPFNFAASPSYFRLEYVRLLPRFQIAVRQEQLLRVSDIQCLCALYSTRFIRSLPCRGELKEEWFVWDTHTHLYFSQEIKALIVTALSVLHRYYCPAEIRIFILRLLMERPKVEFL